MKLPIIAIAGEVSSQK